MKQVKEMGIVAVCLLLLGFGICMGIGTYLMYRDGEEEYDNLREYVAVEEPKERKDGETPEENQEETVTVDFEALKKINPLPGYGSRTPGLIIRLCRELTMNII